MGPPTSREWTDVTTPIRDAGVSFRGRRLRGAKGFIDGTPRQEDPSETLERIAAHFPQIGLTRLANITGLDRIGIPVALAISPAARGFSSTAGKGLTVAQSLVSAAMECFERSLAEQARLEAFTAPYEALDNHGARPRLEGLPLTGDSLFRPDLPERWTMGWDIVNACETAAPVAMVRAAALLDDPAEKVSFQCTSNGLGAGTCLVEAILQALIELIERDGVACHFARARSQGYTVPDGRVRLETIEYPIIRDLLDQLEAAEVEPIVLDCATDLDIPVYCCYLADRRRSDVGLFRGYGASLDPAVAMGRAITEAAQARAYLGSGCVRETQYNWEYVNLRVAGSWYGAEGLAQAAPKIDARNRSSLATDTFEGDIDVCLDRMGRAGLDQVIVFDLSDARFPLSVVKVIAPGLEGYPFFGFYAPGPRALAWQEETL